MEEAVLQWHSHICPLPQGWELLESNLLHLLSVEQMHRDPGAPGWSWSNVDSLPRGLERLPCKHVACAASLEYFYWINAVFKRLPFVFPTETSTSNSSFFVAYRNSRRIARFTISLSPSWGCFFSISVFMLPGWKMRNKYIETSEQKKPWDGSSAQV